jgi:hypothetical protein
MGMGVGCDCVACVAAEPAPSSDNSVGAAGAAVFAAALEKNSSLQTLGLYGELFDFDIVCRDLMILIELFWGVVIVVCFVAWAWAWVAIVLLVSLLNLRHHQGTRRLLRFFCCEIFRFFLFFCSFFCFFFFSHFCSPS